MNKIVELARDIFANTDYSIQNAHVQAIEFFEFEKVAQDRHFMGVERINSIDVENLSSMEIQLIFNEVKSVMMTDRILRSCYASNIGKINTNVAKALKELLKGVGDKGQQLEIIKFLESC